MEKFNLTQTGAQIQADLNFVDTEYNKTLNLFNPYLEQSTTYGSAVISDNGNTITITGTYYCEFLFGTSLPAGTYSLSFTLPGTTANTGIRLRYEDDTYSSMTSSGGSVTTSKNVKGLMIYCASGTSTTVVYQNVMLNEGSTALPYQPYSGEVIHKKEIEPVLIWTNSSPSSSMSGNTEINLNQSLNNFKYIIVEYSITNSSASRFYRKFRVKENIQINEVVAKWADTYSVILVSRPLYYTNETTYTSDSCYSSGSSKNEYLIPQAIYGTNIL